MTRKTKKKPTPDPRQVPTNTQRAVKRIESQSFSGPLPHPEILKKYDQIVPDAASRIIKMAEEQSAHRQKLERTTIESDTKNARLGLHYGLIIGLASIIGGVICVMYGGQVGGSIIGGGGITGLVGVFVYGSRLRQKEREKRFDAVTNPK